MIAPGERRSQFPSTTLAGVWMCHLFPCGWSALPLRAPAAISRSERPRALGRSVAARADYADRAMDLDPGSVLAGLLVSGAGLVLFRYGKSQVRVPQMIVGAAMMAAPFFTPGWLVTLAVGAGLGAALWVGVRMGM
jgi:hypothetical protein